MAFLEMKNVSTGFGPAGGRTEVLKNVNLSVLENEFLAIVGFSGSGKSTLISLLAGLVLPDSGTILVGGKPVREPSPELGIMFQNYSLLPWLTVYGNIELAVRQVFPELKKNDLRAHVEKYIGMVNLLPALDKKPHELSGGMRQRASLARTLSMQPQILLLDEPLSALDALTRSNIQDEIIRIWNQDRRTVVMITNDVDEAILMADRIVPLTMGPDATLAESIPVDLPRPRNRTTLNTNVDYRRLRNRINRLMVEMNEESKLLKTRRAVDLPDIMPIDFSVAPNKPYRKTRERLAKVVDRETTFFKS